MRQLKATPRSLLPQLSLFSPLPPLPRFPRPWYTSYVRPPTILAAIQATFSARTTLPLRAAGSFYVRTFQTISTIVHTHNSTRVSTPKINTTFLLALFRPFWGWGWGLGWGWTALCVFCTYRLMERNTIFDPLGISLSICTVGSTLSKAFLNASQHQDRAHVSTKRLQCLERQRSNFSLIG